MNPKIHSPKENQMFTILATLIGIMVSFFSLFGKGRKVAFERLVKFVIIGACIDALIFVTLFVCMIFGFI